MEKKKYQKPNEKYYLTEVELASLICSSPNPGGGSNARELRGAWDEDEDPSE